MDTESERVEIGGVFQIGDVFQIAGLVREVKNPSWRWYKFWLPRMIASDELVNFTVVEPN